MKHSIAHGLSVEQARQAVRRAVDSYATRFAKYHPQVVWKDEGHAAIGFTAKGFHLKGELAVESDCFVVEADVPFLLRPFTKRAIEVIDNEARRWIENANS